MPFLGLNENEVRTTASCVRRYRAAAEAGRWHHEMNIEDYRIDKTALRRGYSIGHLARSMKRDMLILFPTTIVLMVVGEVTGSRPVTIASYVSFAAIFAAFIARLLHFTLTTPLGCPVCRQQLSRLTQHQTQYVVCHSCRSIYAAYQKNDNPDRLYQEVDIQSALDADKKVPTTPRTVP